MLSRPFYYVLALLVMGVVLTTLYAMPEQGNDPLRLGDNVAGQWIYEDVEEGFRQAKKTGKPLLVSFR